LNLTHAKDLYEPSPILRNCCLVALLVAKGSKDYTLHLLDWACDGLSALLCSLSCVISLGWPSRRASHTYIPGRGRQGDTNTPGQEREGCQETSAPVPGTRDRSPTPCVVPAPSSKDSTGSRSTHRTNDQREALVRCALYYGVARLRSERGRYQPWDAAFVRLFGNPRFCRNVRTEPQ